MAADSFTVMISLDSTAASNLLTVKVAEKPSTKKLDTDNASGE